MLREVCVNSLRCSGEASKRHCSKRGVHDYVRLGANAVVHSADGITAVKSFLRRSSSLATSPQAQAEFLFAQEHLVHPHIVRVMQLDLENACMRMEFVDGGSLEELLQSYGPLPETEAVRFAAHIALGLSCLHRNDLLHRDVKPANVLIDARTRTGKLTDWIGVDEENASLSQGKPVGTPVFMAPEVAGLPHRHTMASDTWALGCTVLNMLTGLLPWEKADKLGRTNEYMAMWLTAHGHAPPYDAGSWTPCLVAFVTACLTADVNARPCAGELCAHALFLGHRQQ